MYPTLLEIKPYHRKMATHTSEIDWLNGFGLSHLSAIGWMGRNRLGGMHVSVGADPQAADAILTAVDLKIKIKS